MGIRIGIVGAGTTVAIADRHVEGFLAQAGRCTVTAVCSRTLEGCRRLCIRHGLDGVRMTTRLEELLDVLGLRGREKYLPNQLSGGQQQRVAIARALALHPDILCFDEPTSALDPELTGEVLKVLRDLADRKTTMIIVTHEMHFARDVADRILFMDGGVVVEEGPAKQLIDHPREERTRQFLAHYSE